MIQVSNRIQRIDLNRLPAWIFAYKFARCFNIDAQ